MPDIPRASILVVDDTRANLRFLAEILTQQGYVVRPALDGTMALSSAQAKPPDLILLDIMMPRMDGYEVCASLKADERTREIPVIFLSALNEVVDKVKAFEMGGVDYITKPFQVEEVLARVATHLALRQLQRRLQEKNEQFHQANQELTRLNGELSCLNDKLTREIAERERTQAALQQYACELEASNAELDAFAHTVAHDLRTPLTALIGFSSLLERRFENLPPEQVRDRLQVITQSGHKMTSIINELLLLASVRKMEEVDTGTLDMAGIVNEAQNRLRDMITEEEAEICIAEIWPPVTGYAPWVEEVWANYISNAVKYGGRPEEGNPPRVEIGWSEIEEASSQISASSPPCPPTSPYPSASLRFWVRDNGPGIPAEEQSRLFAEFTRLEQTRAKGHGLGLSIVRRIVEKLGGQVGVESYVGQGSQFWFTLPGRKEWR
ncbi:MAG: response regulator [Anaerolineae bacterium]|nr:response regulator [Anaerolineae bacterium]